MRIGWLDGSGSRSSWTEKDSQKIMGVGLEAAQRTPSCSAPLVYMTWKWEAQGFHDVGRRGGYFEEI